MSNIAHAADVTPGPSQAVLIDITNVQSKKSDVQPMSNIAHAADVTPGPSQAVLMDITNVQSKKSDVQVKRHRRNKKHGDYYIQSRKCLKKICQLRNRLMKSKSLKNKDVLRILSEESDFRKKGVRKIVKQPLAYYISGANITADRVVVLIKETIHACFDAGLNITATVCDMAGTNRRALAILGATESNPVIKIENKEVISLFDAPHLLKCFRNMFLKYNIKCKTDISSSGTSGEGLAKWSDIRDFYTTDSANPNFVYAPALRKEHLDPNTKQKMKVNIAAQVLSSSVAGGMFAQISQGLLPTSAVVTANVVLKMDKLFDLCNSSSPDMRRGKMFSTNMSNKSPHREFFKDMKGFFKEITFVGCPRTPPSIEGWIWTLNAMELLWKKMKQFGDIKSLSTRRLQQDALENLFGCIRGNCGSNTNPTTSGFVGGVKTAILSSMAHVTAGNFEDDRNEAIMSNFKDLLTPGMEEKKKQHINNGASFRISC